MRVRLYCRFAIQSTAHTAQVPKIQFNSILFSSIREMKQLIMPINIGTGLGGCPAETGAIIYSGDARRPHLRLLWTPKFSFSDFATFLTKRRGKSKKCSFGNIENFVFICRNFTKFQKISPTPKFSFLKK